MGNTRFERVGKIGRQTAQLDIQPRMIVCTRHSLGSTVYCITLVLLFNCVCSQNYEGDMCIISRTNTNGQCTLLSDCPKAIDDLRLRNIYPQTCGFEGANPIVCCDDNQPNKISSSERGLIPKDSKSKQKCKEYAEKYKIISTIDVIPLVPDPVPVNLKQSCVQNDGYLIQGYKARPRELPHMAAIGYPGRHYVDVWWICSGVLISEKFVLTAAHCLHNRLPVPEFVRLGHLDLYSIEDDDSPQEFQVASIFVHPDFKPPSLYNDIGLIELDKTVTITEHVRPACLYTNLTLPSQNAIASAWEYQTSNYSNYLFKETLKVSSHADCQRSFENVNYEGILKHGILDATQVCTGSANSHQTSCVETTGALQTYNNEEYCMYDIIGISSLYKNCSEKNLPNIFTRVSAYIPWIESIVWPVKTK